MILPRLRGAAGPARVPEGDSDSDKQLQGIPVDSSVRKSVYHSIRQPLLNNVKYQDPLCTLLRYISTVSALTCVIISLLC